MQPLERVLVLSGANQFGGHGEVMGAMPCPVHPGRNEEAPASSDAGASICVGTNLPGSEQRIQPRRGAKSVDQA